jgi:hypothetical protein
MPLPRTAQRVFPDSSRPQQKTGNRGDVSSSWVTRNAPARDNGGYEGRFRASPEIQDGLVPAPQGGVSIGVQQRLLHGQSAAFTDSMSATGVNPKSTCNSHEPHSTAPAGTGSREAAGRVTVHGVATPASSLAGATTSIAMNRSRDPCLDPRRSSSSSRFLSRSLSTTIGITIGTKMHG